MSEAGRLGGVFYDPGKAFADIAARPRWWPPVVLIIIASLAMMYCFSQRVGWESMVRKQMESSDRTQNMTPEQRERAIQQGAKFAAPISYVSVIVGPVVVYLIIAGLMMLVFNVMMGAGLRFPQAMAITTYSSLTGIVAVALAIFVLYLTPPENIDIQTAASFDLGAFVGNDGPKWLKSFAGSFDIFRFWGMALMVVGVQAAAPKKLTVGKAIIGVLAPWAIWVLGKTAFVAAFSK